MDKWRETLAKRTDEQKAPRPRRNHPRATNPSHVAHVVSQAKTHENRSNAATQSAPKRQKTMKELNAALAPGMAASMEHWSSKERRKLLDAYDAYGDKWKDVAAAVGSRTWRQCKRQYADLKRAKRLDPISEDTPLRAKIFPGFHASAFDKCVAEIDGKRITTVGQLAALDLGDIEYLKKLTGYAPSVAVPTATKWKAKAEEALAFWQ